MASWVLHTCFGLLSHVVVLTKMTNLDWLIFIQFGTVNLAYCLRPHSSIHNSVAAVSYELPSLLCVSPVLRSR